MYEFIQSMSDVFLDRTIEELVGAVMIALVLALALAGIYTIARRKLNDPHMLMIGLMLFASILSMALAAGYVANARKALMPDEGSPPYAAWRPPPGPHPGPGGPRVRSLAPWIIAAADADKDGRLTSEEAAQFVLRADTSGKGSLDARELADALMRGRPELPPAQ